MRSHKYESGEDYSTLAESVRIIKAVEISVFSHATEDTDKVKSAVRRFLPDSLKGQEFETVKLSGHYNDPILILTLNVKNKKDATEIVDKTFQKLSSLDQQTILDDLTNRVDSSGNMFLRFNKQKAFKNKFVLADNDPIRMKIKSQIPHKTDPVKNLRKYLEDLNKSGEVE